MHSKLKMVSVLGNPFFNLICFVLSCPSIAYVVPGLELTIHTMETMK